MEQFAAVRRSKDGQPVRYLVVDDSVFARKNLARMIETFGGQIAGEAGDGLTAITEYDRTSPDIVLMDITMPQMEGIEAAEKIVTSHPEARIVMVSSVGYQENIVAALQRGIEGGLDVVGVTFDVRFLELVFLAHRGLRVCVHSAVEFRI